MNVFRLWHVYLSHFLTNNLRVALYTLIRILVSNTFYNNLHLFISSIAKSSREAYSICRRSLRANKNR